MAWKSNVSDGALLNCMISFLTNRQLTTTYDTISYNYTEKTVWNVAINHPTSGPTKKYKRHISWSKLSKQYWVYLRDWLIFMYFVSWGEGNGVWLACSLQGLSLAEVSIAKHFLSYGGSTCSIATTVPRTPIEELEENDADEENGWSLLSIFHGVLKIVLRGKNDKQDPWEEWCCIFLSMIREYSNYSSKLFAEECFLTSHFRDRTLCIEEPVGKTTSLTAHKVHMGQRMTLVSLKVEMLGSEVRMVGEKCGTQTEGLWLLYGTLKSCSVD